MIFSLTFIFLLPFIMGGLFFNCSGINRQQKMYTSIDTCSNLIEKGVLVNGKKEGYWVTLDTNYLLLYEQCYSNGLANGRIVFYTNRKISIEGEKKDGFYNGEWTYYYKYPVKSMEGVFKMGKKDGQWKVYDRNGKLEQIVTFNNDSMGKIEKAVK